MNNLPTMLEDRVLIKPKQAETMTPGGIALPSSVQDIPRQGTVLTVGPGRVTEYDNRLDMTVEEGDEVIFQAHYGAEVELEGEKLLILRESEILAILSSQEK